jgi:phosphoribosylanthranilate isomerase
MRLIAAFSVGEKNDLLEITRFLKKCRQNRGELPGSSGPSLAAWMKKPRPRPILPAAILVDARVPGHFGGTGKTAPWELLAEFHPGVPLILAGGLTPDNVAEAVRIVRPYGVDVASGVESSPGVKDPEKMKRFIKNAREAAEK